RSHQKFQVLRSPTAQTNKNVRNEQCRWEREPRLGGGVADGRNGSTHTNSLVNIEVVFQQFSYTGVAELHLQDDSKPQVRVMAEEEYGKQVHGVNEWLLGLHTNTAISSSISNLVQAANTGFLEFAVG